MGDGWAKAALRSAALQLPTLPGKETGAGPSNRQRSAEVAELHREDGEVPAADTQGRAGTSALRIALLVLTPPRARWNAPVICGTGDTYTSVCVYNIYVLLFFALPGFSSSSDFADGRSEGL